MRIFLFGAISAAIFAGTIGMANAQSAPREVIGADTIEMRNGQTRTFTFEQPVTRFSVSAEGIAEIRPETDRTFTIRALSAGQVLMTAYAQDGHVVHRSYIAVADAGRLVRVYGFDMKLTKDYVGFYCTDVGCGRADPDIGPKPYSTVISETQGKGDGNSATTTREVR
ncbi:pilus assembly protein N-terminal domain-containing protein [Bradyrhizobium sp. Bra78]|uniref:pilus assembly protein N-terminal domain-containing protein n=1 Tax=Bradyrhizobium sp. Bra78 TaxID=2926010 RepID=UPI0021C97488|nr:pilus assembly protein N-terminal domain-containing protein [Bradyrhizobium sp. Bra78]